jgi:hypothetical protein
MSDSDKATWRRQFEEMGENQVRAKFQDWHHSLHTYAIQWLAERDQESTRLDEVSRAEQIEIARSAKDAASEANALAAEANFIARDAATSARAAADAAALNARAARTNNTIATLALIAAVIAIAISILGIFIKH